MSINFTNRSTVAQGIRKRTIAQVLHVGPLSLRFITLLLFASVALFYLAQTTQSATQSYDIEALSRDKEKLEKNLNDLKTTELRLRALNELKASAVEQGLVPIAQ